MYNEDGKQISSARAYNHGLKGAAPDPTGQMM